MFIPPGTSPYPTYGGGKNLPSYLLKRDHVSFGVYVSLFDEGFFHCIPLQRLFIQRMRGEASRKIYGLNGLDICTKIPEKMLNLKWICKRATR